jgi:NAD(P)H-dependent FMN reductase
MTIKVGLILGSTRIHSNTKGIARWLTATLSQSYSDEIELSTINLASSPGHPLPLLIQDVIPAALDAASPQYVNPDVQSWSHTVRSFDAIIILTPQYNRGIPAPLKNSLDHLYHEWDKKPVMLVCFGGHGGTVVEASLRTVLASGLKMDVVEKTVNIVLPKEVITGAGRASGDEEWIVAKEVELKECVSELVAKVKSRQ